MNTVAPRRLLITLIKTRPMSSSNTPSSFPVTSSIRHKLSTGLQPITHLEVVNESHMHNVPQNSETHFKVVVVSDKFNDIKSPLQRHRIVNSLLSEELDGPVHALSIVAKSPAQWEKNNSIPASPSCRGGDGSLPSR